MQRSVAGAREPRSDVLVLGAGASGSVVVRYLAERGFRVTCLEQGGWVNASEYPGDKPEWELLASQRWHRDFNDRHLGQGLVQ